MEDSRRGSIAYLSPEAISLYSEPVNPSYLYDQSDIALCSCRMFDTSLYVVCAR
jgi:hypothetical protein